mmetsp:Transcript_49635/g.130544  ORF Transcript_49635/g.130544 Transcript_49635/m.130544 type:complete len:217 (-) Transcript_49635:276-926(-)
MRRAAPAVVGPDLDEVAGIYHKAVRVRAHADPRAVGQLRLQAVRGAVLPQDGEAGVVGVRTVPQRAGRPLVIVWSERWVVREAQVALGFGKVGGKVIGGQLERHGRQLHDCAQQPLHALPVERDRRLQRGRRRRHHRLQCRIATVRKDEVFDQVGRTPGALCTAPRHGLHSHWHEPARAVAHIEARLHFLRVLELEELQRSLVHFVDCLTWHAVTD